MILNKLLFVALLVSCSAMSAHNGIITKPTNALELATTVCGNVGGKLTLETLCETEGELSYFLTDSTVDILRCANTFLTINTNKVRSCFFVGYKKNEERILRLGPHLISKGIYIYHVYLPVGI